MKRRVLRIGDRRFRIELAGNDVSEFSYREKPRRWDPVRRIHVDFEPEEDRYILTWDNMFIESFRREEDVLLFILRFGYDISDRYLVPSEILADFNLVYEAGDWVDEWYCTDRHEVIFTQEPIHRPFNRNIRFVGYPRITPEAPQKQQSFHRYDWEATRRREVVAEIEIPELDFAKLERPRIRRRQVPRNWADKSESAWGAFWSRNRIIPIPPPDEECVFTLKSGAEAEKAAE